MCGFIVAVANPGSEVDDCGVRASLDRMASRGPDDGGLWQAEGVSLGHRRLAILDLDRRSAQPMHSACGRYTIVLNGEIYNFASLRIELQAKGVVFRTSSDTEVLLGLFEEEGEAMLPKLRGMFAFFIWDKLARRGFAARDPYGIKPLYIARARDGILLGSQVKALLATGRVEITPDLRGQAGFWLLGSVPEPHTWYRDINALPAGHCVWIERGRIDQPRHWFDIGDVWRSATDCHMADSEVQEAVCAVLRETVSRHLVADVPVAVLLSGGIDSGALAGMMAEVGVGNVAGITIAYDEFAGRHEDEAPVAAMLAADYGIQHHVRRVTRNEFQADLPRILAAMDQPSIDGINTWYASKAVAERGYKVVVSGVGGDELFQGYGSFRQLPRIVEYRRRIGCLPGAASLLTLAGRFQAYRSGKARWEHVADWSRTIAGAWWLRRSVHAPEDLPRLMGPEQAALALREFSPISWVEAMSGPLPDDPMLALGQIESTTYLRNQLLRDSDWASMDHSVELRTPLVDAYLLHCLQPFLRAFARFPGKVLLAKSPVKALPREIVNRRKTGFGIPVGRWMSTSGGPKAVDSRGWAYSVAEAYTKSCV